MYRQVEDMVTRQSQLMEMVVEAKGEISNKSGGAEIKDGGKVAKVTDGTIVNNVSPVIKVKWTVKGIGIDNNAQKADEERPVPVFNPSFFHLAVLLPGGQFSAP